MSAQSNGGEPLAGLRICFLAGTLGQGGAERQLFHMLDQLQRAGARVTLLCLTQGEFWERRIVELGVPCIWVGQKKSRLRRLFRIFQELRRDRPDIVQSQHFYTNLYAAVAGRASGLPAIGAIRSNVFGEVRDNGRVLGNLCLHLPHLLAVNSSAAIENALTRGIAPGKLWLVPNAVDVDRFHPDANKCAGKRDGAFQILSAGRMDALKRFDLVLRVIDRLRREARVPIRAVLAGDGPLRSSLEKQAAELNLLDCVEFRGQVADLAPLYRESDALLLASDQEGTPNVILEAMASGLAVVATAVGGIPGIITSGKNGFLAPPGEEEGLVNALLRLTESDTLRAEIGGQARAFAAASHAPSSVLTALGGLYRAALGFGAGSGT